MYKSSAYPGDPGAYDRYPGYYTPAAPADVRRAVQPLVEQIGRYDGLRQRLYTQGGNASDLHTLVALLNDTIPLGHGAPASLADPKTLRTALYRAAGPDVHFQVRVLPNGFPAYYLCRLHQEYWAGYGLIVEDLCLSDDYPLRDGRFVPLMNYSGHESYYLRLSPLRAAALASTRQTDADRHEPLADRLLLRAGNQVLQSAWHDDQRAALLAAEHFELQELLRATELAYLVLGAELCDLRAAADDELCGFFRDVYPHPGIHRLLVLLPTIDGDALARLQGQAQRHYARLGKVFRDFMRIEIRWETAPRPVPLHKLLYANIYRMALVADRVREDDGLREALAAVQTRAVEVGNALLTA